MKKVDQAVKEMKSYLKELDELLNSKVVDKLPKETKEKAKEIVKDTKNAINNSIEKVNKAVDSIKEDERLDDLLDEIKARSKEAIDFTKTKIENLDKDKDGQIFDDLYNDIMSEFDKLKENEIVKKTSVYIKNFSNKVNEYLDKPEVKDTISKAKVATVKIAEKGVKGLKKVLDVDDKKAAAKKTTKAKKPATKKTTAKKTTKKTKEA